VEIVECELFARGHQRGLKSGGRRNGILAGVTRHHGRKPALIFCRFDDGIATITATGNHGRTMANDSVILDGMHQMVPL
jgi:hypothetical protein